MQPECAGWSAAASGWRIRRQSWLRPPATTRCATEESRIKGKSAIHLARVYGEHKRNFVGQSFWARGYFVSTVGRDEAVIRRYIQDQEHEDKRLDQLNLWR